MRFKTISMHYGPSFSLAHNNRQFIPKNVDPMRTSWNYNCITAGDEAYIDFENPRFAHEFWEKYKELNDIYWSNYALVSTLEYEQYQENMRHLRRCRQMFDFNPSNEVESFFYLLLLPLIILHNIALTIDEIALDWEHFHFKCEQWKHLEDFKESKLTARELFEATGCCSLEYMDYLAREAARAAGNAMDASTPVNPAPKRQERFATLEEIYGKVFEPSFREFQEKQRPCRRYNGTYLEQIREGQLEASLKKQQNKQCKNRKTSEAIEFVIGIGDTDNTGYAAAFNDAKESEMLLKNYCDYLKAQKNICYVTTKELDDPNWQPPFKHGLIIVNLTVHCDEATPGIHLTCIPYSRGCKRGPAAQASLGRAMTGMGYPSTWKDALDESGNRIPKRDRNNNIVYNNDGSIRYLQEPDKQGVIDWIEDQKAWIQEEMRISYGWEREYKGSHPRGNLSTPDYQVARAAERKREIEQGINKMLNSLTDEINSEIERLDTTVVKVWRDSNSWDLLLRYLEVCTDEEYLEYVHRAEEHLAGIPARAQEEAKKELSVLINMAREKNSKQVPKKETSHPKQIR